METKILLTTEETLIEIANKVAAKIESPSIVYVASDNHLGYPSVKHVSKTKQCNTSINSFPLMEMVKINYKNRFLRGGSSKYKIVTACKHYKCFTKMAKSLKRSIIAKHLEL